MTEATLGFVAAERSTLPDRLKSQLPPMMQKLDVYGYRLPPPRLGHYRKALALSPSRFESVIVTVACLGERAVGYANATWTLEGANLDRANLTLFIEEGERKRGRGTALLKQVLRGLPARIAIISPWAMKDTPGERFYQKTLKVIPKHTVLQSVSQIRQFDGAVISEKAIKAKQEAQQKGFTLLEVKQDDFSSIDLRAFLRMKDRITRDMPKEELTLEDEVITEDKLREFHRRLKEKGCRYTTFVAQDDETGQPVGLSEVLIREDQSEVAWQESTGVLHEFRGNALGMTLKLQVLDRLLRRTAVTHWTTDNAGSNVHMLRINRELGFVPWMAGHVYEVTRRDWERFLKAG